MLDLEKLFKAQARKYKKCFPRNNFDYWNHYDSMLTVLNHSFYPYNDVGLSVHSGSIAGIYTSHSKDHFDEVVHFAGLLLGLAEEQPDNPLTPFELYLLLMGIRLHDVGNIFGREHHEKRAIDIYKQATAPASRDTFETRVIVDLARVHGGKADDGSKDTISSLLPVDSLGRQIRFYPQGVAALIRFADEICEHRGRVNLTMMDLELIPRENVIYHLYAASIKSCTVNRADKTISIDFLLHKNDLMKKFPKLGEEVYLVDEIKARLCKLDQERRYCNRFLLPNLRTKKMEISILIADGNEYQTVLWKKTFTIPAQPRGYPDEDTTWQATIREFVGSTLAEKYSATAEV